MALYVLYEKLPKNPVTYRCCKKTPLGVSRILMIINNFPKICCFQLYYNFIANMWFYNLFLIYFIWNKFFKIIDTHYVLLLVVDNKMVLRFPVGIIRA